MSLIRLDALDRVGPWAPLVIRLFLGSVLILMTQDNVLSAARMEEFVGFLRQFGFPMPEIAARVSVYAQLGCGILILLGALTRWASLVVVINFVVAIVGVHLSLPFRSWLEPMAMLSCALGLFLAGAGRFSVDHALRRT